MAQSSGWNSPGCALNTGSHNSRSKHWPKQTSSCRTPPACSTCLARCNSTSDLAQKQSAHWAKPQPSTQTIRKSTLTLRAHKMQLSPHWHLPAISARWIQEFQSRPSTPASARLRSAWATTRSPARHCSKHIAMATTPSIPYWHLELLWKKMKTGRLPARYITLDCRAMLTTAS